MEYDQTPSVRSQSDFPFSRHKRSHFPLLTEPIPAFTSTFDHKRYFDYLFKVICRVIGYGIGNVVWYVMLWPTFVMNPPSGHDSQRPFSPVMAF